jgi:hypothetical protein
MAKEGTQGYNLYDMLASSSCKGVFIDKYFIRSVDRSHDSLIKLLDKHPFDKPLTIIFEDPSLMPKIFQKAFEMTLE